MEKDNNIKRGVDFATRIGQTALPLRRAFGWWTGEKLNKKTLIFIAAVWLLNLLIIYPILGRDLKSAYSLSFILLSIGNFLHRYLFIDPHYFFWFLTFSSLTFAPIGFYLFVRRIALRHELTALIATLIYISPNPFFGNVPVLANSLLKGDGSHVLIISFIPFFLLYVQAFLSTGASVLFFLTAVGLACIALISPFSALNFLIFFSVFLLAEGFQGELRIKIIRGFVLLITACALSFFWYFPTKLIKFMGLNYVEFTISKFLGVLPAAIPIIPVGGALAFLIFDRRAKLKPIFVSLSLFLIYLTVYSISGQLSISGILSSDRYLPELAVSSSLILAIILIFLIELFFKRLVFAVQNRLRYFIIILLTTVIVAILGIFALKSFNLAHDFVRSEPVNIIYSEGVGNASGFGYWIDFSSIIAGIISLATFLFLIYIMCKYPVKLQSKPKS